VFTRLGASRSRKPREAATRSLAVAEPAAAPAMWLRSVELLAALTRADLRSRYGRDRLRLLKWLTDPIALVGVYLLFVTMVVSRPGLAPGLNVACAVVPFQLIMMAVIGAFWSIWNRAPIISNMPFPRMLVPLASTLTEALGFSAGLGLLAALMAFYSITPTAAIAWLPLVLAVNLLLAAAAAYPAALVGLCFQESIPAATSVMRALFFLAPGVVALDHISGTAHTLVELNPLTGVFEAYRSVLLRGHAPSAWELLVPVAAALALIAIFVPMYSRAQRHFAKVVE
jgi:lipopolysaccharide transport system permease protein